MDKEVLGIVLSRAKYTFNMILKALQQSGYDISLDGNVEFVSGNNLIPQYRQNYKIKSCINDPKTKKYILSENAPLMTVSLLGRTENDNKIVLNLGARIPDTKFDWEGEDETLYVLRDAFIEDAKSDIINYMSEYIVDVEELTKDVISEEQICKCLEDSVLRIYEGLYNHINESKGTDEEVSLEDLEMKINTIMDALGLEREDEEDKNEENKDTVVVDDTETSDNNTKITTDNDVIDIVDETEEKEV